MSLEPHKLISELEKMLNLIEGVSVVRTVATVEHLTIDFTVTTPEARLLLTYCAEAANIRMHSWAHYRPGTKEAIRDPESAIHYRFTAAKRSDVEHDLIESFMDLGAHLTWLMHKTSLISDEEERGYCATFNAASRST